MAKIKVQAETEFVDLEGQQRRIPGECWETDLARVKFLEERGLVKRAPAPRSDKRGRGPGKNKSVRGPGTDK